MLNSRPAEYNGAVYVWGNGITMSRVCQMKRRVPTALQCPTGSSAMHLGSRALDIFPARLYHHPLSLHMAPNKAIANWVLYTLASFSSGPYEPTYLYLAKPRCGELLSGYRDRFDSMFSRLFLVPRSLPHVATSLLSDQGTWR